MMFERLSDSARSVIVQAQDDARRLGHGFIGCEHLLLAVAAADEPAGAVLRDHNITPERIEATFLGIIAPLSGLDEEALASIGIDLDAVRTRVEAEFGPGALTRGLPAAAKSRRPAWGKGPLAELQRRRRRRRVPDYVPQAAGPRGNPPQAAVPRGRAPVPPGPALRGHIPFTPRARKTLQVSVREADALRDGSVGVQHIALALFLPREGTVPRILAALDVPPALIRAAILARYRKAS